MTVKTQATIEDLYHVDGKAEIVNGEIIHMPPTGFLPGRTGGTIYRGLSAHERKAKSGLPFPTTSASMYICRIASLLVRMQPGSPANQQG